GKSWASMTRTWFPVGHPGGAIALLGALTSGIEGSVGADDGWSEQAAMKRRPARTGRTRDLMTAPSGETDESVSGDSGKVAFSARLMRGGFLANVLCAFAPTC